MCLSDQHSDRCWRHKYRESRCHRYVSYLIVILYVFRPPKGQKFREPVASMNYYIPTQFTDNSILSYGPTSCSAAGLEHIQVLPFSIEGDEEAVSQAEEESIDGINIANP